MYNLTMIVTDADKASAQTLIDNTGEAGSEYFDIELTDGTDTFWSQEHRSDSITNALLNSGLLHYVTVNPYFREGIKEVGLELVTQPVEM